MTSMSASRDAGALPRPVAALVTILLASLLVATPGVVGAASTNTGTFQYLVGEALGGEFGPAIASTSDGTSLEMSGNGSFSIGNGPKQVSGGGTYVVRDVDGMEIASGSWTLTQLGGFVNWGCVVVDGENFCTGQLRAEVSLDGFGAGRIWITCLGPEAPPSAEGGVRVNVGPVHFDEIAPGSGTVFVP